MRRRKITSIALSFAMTASVALPVRAGMSKVLSASGCTSIKSSKSTPSLQGYSIVTRFTPQLNRKTELHTTQKT